jgi:mannose/fructose/N-acetylgalactosamine-specific phosphotransferase system component IID
MVYQVDDIEHGKKPVSSRSTGAIQESIDSLLDLLNPALSIVLVLVVRFTLKIGDAVHAQDLLNILSNLSLSVVTEESISGTILANIILKCVDMSCSEVIG